MNETLLHDALHDAVADVHLTEDVLGAARRGNRRRTGARAATGTTVLALAGVATLSLQPSHKSPAIASPNTTPTVTPVAFVQQRVAAALADTDAFLITSTVTGDGSGATMTVYRDTRDGRQRLVAQRPDGSTVIETGTHVRPDGRVDFVTVDHTTGSVTRSVEPSDLLAASDRLGVNPRGPQELRDAVTSGTLTEVGPDSVDGHDALHLRLTGSARALTAPDGSVVDLWVDPRSYELLRMTVAGPKGGLLTQDLAWTPITAAGEAEATVTVPSP